MSPGFARACAATLAAGLFALGLPQTVDAAWRLHAESGLDLYNPGAAAANAAAAYPSLEALDGTLGDPEARIDAAMLRLGLASDAKDLGAAQALVTGAADDLASGLAREPGSDLGWYELADARLRQGRLGAARDALKTSMLLGYYDPTLNLVRGELGMRLWLVLAPDDLRLVQNEIRFAWLSQPEELAALAHRDPWYATIIRRSLDEASLPAFEREFSRHH